MKLFAFSLLSLISAAVAAPQNLQSVSYDATYDAAGTALTALACSDGSNGLISKGYKTLGDIPSFPYVAGVSAISGWNSPSCGTCWKVTYNGKSIKVLGVDVSKDGVNTGQKAMDELTNGQAVSLGRIQASVEQVASSECGL
ncbi:hypothetical protein KEM55_001818 [Ascosphaera atra]|nr:hypothetical protein KEM55_001818 [Ascosphaera atra]